MKNQSANQVLSWQSLLGIVLLTMGGIFWYVLRGSDGERTIQSDSPGINDASATNRNPHRGMGTLLPDDDYVGSAACAECHPRIAEMYQSHPMANSLWKMTTAPAIEDYHATESFSPDEHHVYSVEKTADDIQHRERLVSTEGETIFDQAMTIDYAVGSGAQGRSYLIDRNGIITMSPLSWYTSTQKWDLSPGYSLPHHKRFDRRITEACLDCHAGHLNSPRGTDDRFNNPPFFELAIGCERCHGPGGAHVRFRRDLNHVAELDPIINPAKLDPARREDVCSQCHLQGEGRIPHVGSEVGDFRPGQRLEETCVVLVKPEQAVAGTSSRAVSQVEQIRSSVCFIQSNGRMGCISCHDPHYRPQQSELVDFYRAKCLNCHQKHGCSLDHEVRIARQPNDSCFTCHMPSMGTSDVPHAANSDHRILRTPSRNSGTALARNEMPIPFDQAGERLEQPIVDRALGIWLAHQAQNKFDIPLATRSVHLLNSVFDRDPNDADVSESLGIASAVLGRTEPSIIYWRKTLEIEPDRELSLRMLSISLDNTERSEEALPFMRRYLDINPTDAAIWNRYSGILERLGQNKEALSAAETAISLDPSKSEYLRWLATLLQKAGQSTEARRLMEISNSILGAYRNPIQQ